MFEDVLNRQGTAKTTANRAESCLANDYLPECLVRLWRDIGLGSVLLARAGAGVSSAKSGGFGCSIIGGAIDSLECALAVHCQATIAASNATNAITSHTAGLIPRFFGGFIARTARISSTSPRRNSLVGPEAAGFCVPAGLSSTDVVDGVEAAGSACGWGSTVNLLLTRKG